MHKIFPGYHHVPKGLSPPPRQPEAETSFFLWWISRGPCLVLYRFWSPVLPLGGADLKKGLFWKEKGAKGDVHERNDDHGIYVCVGVKKNKYIYIYICTYVVIQLYTHVYICT